MIENDRRLLHIGEAIAAERERQGISQTELALMLGYTNHAHLSRIECGKKSPSLSMLFDVADTLHVKVNYFFTDI